MKLVMNWDMIESCFGRNIYRKEEKISKEREKKVKKMKKVRIPKGTPPEFRKFFMRAFN